MKILGVDDQADIIDDYGSSIKKRGHSFLAIYDPLKALELLKKEKYDLILLDFMMKTYVDGNYVDYNGDTFVKEVRSDPAILEKNSKVYIILITAYAGIAPPEKMLKDLDIQMYLDKDMFPQQVAIIVESALKQIISDRKVSVFQQGLQSILEAVPNIYQPTFDIVLDNILNEVQRIFVSEDTFLLIDALDKFKKSGDNIFRGRGKYESNIQSVETDLMRYFHVVKTNKEPIKFENGVLIPLLIEHFRPIGYLYVFLENGVSSEVEELLKNYGMIVSAGIGNSILQAEIDLKNEELAENNEKLAQWTIEAADAMKKSIHAKDEFTFGHCERVADIVEKIGTKLGLSPNDINSLKIGANLHDIGKIGIPDKILQKESNLTDEEYKIMQTHTVIGAKIISAIVAYRDVIPCIRHHHERWDGRGYPDGKTGENIPLLGRILAAADTLDAICSKRIYKDPQPLSFARSELIKNKGTQFDPKISDIIVQLIDEGLISYDDVKKKEA